MKVLVAGGSGLVGRCLIEVLEKHKIEYVSTYNSRPIKNGYRVNFEDEDELSKFLDLTKPDVCVNCIVQRLTDVCEKNWNETKQINIELVDKLARTCNAKGVHLIHISTDYVFDGKHQPHYPDSETNPLQNYGISKLISEKRVIANTNSYTIIRVPVLYCDKIDNLEENAVTLIGKKVLNQIEKTSEDDYSIRRPVYIPDFCMFILTCILTKKKGLYHFYNPVDKLTKYGMAKHIADYLGKSHSHIKASGVSATMANRPYDTELNDTSYDITKYSFLPIKDGIELCFSKWKHPNPLEKESNCFMMLDLDGTILDTDKVHYEAYKSTLKEYSIDLSWDEFESAINTSSMDDIFLKYGLSDSDIEKIKGAKYNAMLQLKVIHPIAGAKEFIEGCLAKNVNLVVVTNTSRRVVDHFKEQVEFLNKIPNWICREDYSKAKPNSECYTTAKNKFYKNEEYTIGFENTLNGFYAIKDVVNCVYCITDISNSNYKKLTKEDSYLIKDFRHFLKN